MTEKNEKNLTLRLTEEEGTLLWDLLAAERERIQPVDSPANVIGLCKSIHEKINAAAKIAGL
jgi:hypothetical protein